MLRAVLHHFFEQAFKIDSQGNVAVLCQCIHFVVFRHRVMDTVHKRNNLLSSHAEPLCQLRNPTFQLSDLFADDVFINALFLGQVILPNALYASAVLGKCFLHPIFIQTHVVSLLLYDDMIFVCQFLCRTLHSLQS